MGVTPAPPWPPLGAADGHDEGLGVLGKGEAVDHEAEDVVELRRVPDEDRPHHLRRGGAGGKDLGEGDVGGGDSLWLLKKCWLESGCQLVPP